MKVLICGSRNWEDPGLMIDTIEEYIYSLPRHTIIIHGGARGADTLAGITAESRGLEVREYPANWKEFGRRAGPIRNATMLAKEKPDLVVAFTLNLAESRGTKDMVQRAIAAGIPVEVKP